MKRLPMAAAATVAVLGVAGVIGAVTQTPDASATQVPGQLQKDANAILRQGAPGVLADLSTSTGHVRVRAGVADTTTGKPVPWDAKFRVGSFTKTFVATTVLQLVGEGRLSLDDSVDKWLPGVVTGNGNDGTKITVRQLLQHTSGLPDYLAAPQFAFLGSEEGFTAGRDKDYAARQLVAFAMALKPNFAPGTNWSYSNTNYVLAGLIIRKVTGHDWRAEVTRRIIRPLGLKDTTIPATDHTVPEPHAIGYERFPGPDATATDPKYGPAIDATELSPTWGDAAGAIISTTADGNTFLRALLAGTLLRPAQLAEMKKTVPAPGFQAPFPGARYGLGLMSTPSSCGLIWSHGGDIHGYKTRNGVNSQGSRSIIVSLNTDSLVPEPGAPAPTRDQSLTLIEDALCS
ncbi:serine hydrolase domain-containing protein [Cryptosporangium sp. NPDC051539]|uniref:serine hydrolase domain-containing protein n=1 Tax=Cryptosporangium sp. NPDC051539 TaxID=3363962 RepID=UPI0037B6BB12